MPKTWERVSDDDLRAAYIESGGNIAATARKLGMHERNLYRRCAVLGLGGQGNSEAPELRSPSAELHITPPPATAESIEALLERKRSRMAASKAHDEWAGLIPVSVKEAKPICLMAIGDPHLDDNHCDIEQLEQDLAVIRRTPGMYAGHVGDFTNNWVGRLQKLYAHQSTTFEEGLRLTEWMLKAAPNLFVINGNHDLWNDGADLTRFIMRSATGAHQSHGVRMNLRWPGGEAIRVHARHDFPGDSQFNPVHGLRKETLWGHRDHVLIAGHKHVDGAGMVPSVGGLCHWLLRVSGYKVIDDFAKERNFRPQRAAPSVSLIINPYAAREAEKVKPFWDHEAAADYLKFLRARH